MSLYCDPPQILGPSGLRIDIGIWYQILPRMNQAKRMPRRDAMRATAHRGVSNRKGLRTFGHGFETRQILFCFFLGCLKGRRLTQKGV